MPSKTTRKIIEHGGSGVVAIPKDYRDYNNLEPGAEVIVLYDNVVVIIPKALEEKVEDKEKLIEVLEELLR